MKSNIEILSEIFKPTSFNCKTEMEDLQIAITLNPDLTKILRCMELAQEQVKLCNIPYVNARAFVENCGDMAEYVDGSKIAHRFKKFTIPVIEYNELRNAADKFDSEHVR